MLGETYYQQIENLQGQRANHGSDAASEESWQLLKDKAQAREVLAVARRPQDNAGSAIFALLMGLLPLYFIIFAAKAIQADGAPVTSPRASWLLGAAVFGPTIFPIVFAAILGSFLTSFASNRLEAGVSIGTLEYILGSRSVGSALLSVLRFRFFNAVVPSLVVCWLLSPIGGQSAVRIVSSQAANTVSRVDVSFLDIAAKNESMMLQGLDRYFGTAVLTTFITALGGSGVSKNGSQDAYFNLHIPMVESLTHGPDEDDWYDTTQDHTYLHTALMGIPFTGIPSGFASSFKIETSYMWANCTAEYAFNSSATKRSESPSLNLEDQGHADPDLARIITLVGPMGGQDRFACAVATTYIEVSASCWQDGRNCTVTAIRPSQLVHSSRGSTVLDGASLNTHVPSFTNNSWQLFDYQTGEHGSPSMVFFSGLTSVLGNFNYGSKLGMSALEQFFLTPDTPFRTNDGVGSGISSLTSLTNFGTIGERLISHRLSQLLNTYWLANIAPFALLGNFTVPCVRVDRYLGGDCSYPVGTTAGRASSLELVLYCDKHWAACLIVISTFLVLIGTTTAWLEVQRRGPDVLDSFTGAQRSNAYANFEARSSVESGAEIARRSRNGVLRLGDVKADANIGLIAIARPDSNISVQKLQSGRQYGV